MNHKTTKRFNCLKIIGSKEINHFLRNIQVILMNSQQYYLRLQENKLAHVHKNVTFNQISFPGPIQIRTSNFYTENVAREISSLFKHKKGTKI